MTSIILGNTRRLTATFTDTVGAPTDPVGAVTLTLLSPAGVTTAYTYAAGGLTRASAGVFYRDVTFSTVGVWRYIFEADADGAGLMASSGWAEITVYASASSYTTLLQLKSLFWRYLGQLWTGTASSGSTSSLVDPTLVDLGSDDFPFPVEGKQLRVTSTISDLRRIARVDHATGTLTPNAAFSGAITANSYEVWGNSIHGGDSLTRLFNDVLTVARPLAQTELTIVTGQAMYDITALVRDPADVTEVYVRFIDTANLRPYEPAPIFWWKANPLITAGVQQIALEVFPTLTLSDTNDLWVEHYDALPDFASDTSTVDATYAEWLAWEAVLRHALDRGTGSADRGRWSDLAKRAADEVRAYRSRFMPRKTRRAMHGRPQVM